MAITFCLPIHSQGVSKSFIPMAEIPAGSFYMGSDGLGEDFDEAPIHQAVISRPFRMGITEITNAQYESFRPEHRALRGKNGVSLEDDEAVVNVSYSDAVAFCEWLSRKEGKNYRLPTEAEWEFAAKGGASSKSFKYSGSNNLDDFAWHKGNSKGTPHTVGTKLPNELGIYDMSGNVWEWCWDWYNKDFYKLEKGDNPKGPEMGERRSVRGGSWDSHPNYVRPANRISTEPNKTHEFYGFRVARTITK